MLTYFFTTCSGKGTILGIIKVGRKKLFLSVSKCKFLVVRKEIRLTDQLLTLKTVRVEELVCAYRVGTQDVFQEGSTRVVAGADRVVVLPLRLWWQVRVQGSPVKVGC